MGLGDRLKVEHEGEEGGNDAFLISSLGSRWWCSPSSERCYKRKTSFTGERKLSFGLLRVKWNIFVEMACELDR